MEGSRGSQSVKRLNDNILVIYMYNIYNNYNYIVMIPSTGDFDKRIFAWCKLFLIKNALTNLNVLYF